MADRRVDAVGGVVDRGGEQGSVGDEVEPDVPEKLAKGEGESAKKKRGRPKRMDGVAPTSRKARAKKVSATPSAPRHKKENKAPESALVDLTGDANLRPKRSWTPPLTANSGEESLNTFASKLSEFAHIDAEPKTLSSNADNALLKRKRLEVRL